MTHTTPACIAMRLSKPNTSLTHTSTYSKQVLVFVITLFTLLRAAWLLHSSQVTKYSRAPNDYNSTPPTNSTLSVLTMAIIKSQELKDSSFFNSCASKHSKKKAKKNQKGNTISSPISTTGVVLVQNVAVISPLGKQQQSSSIP